MTWNWTCTDRCTDTHPPSWHFPPHYFTDKLKVFSFFFSWFYLLCMALSRIFLILFMHTLASTLCYLCILRCCSRFKKTLQETRLQEDSKGGIKRLTVPDGRRFTNPQWVVEVMKSLISDSLEAPPRPAKQLQNDRSGSMCASVFVSSDAHHVSFTRQRRA